MLKNIGKIKNIKLKVVSIFLLMTLMSLQLSPFMLRATATQLQFSSPGLITPATDIAYNKNVFFTNAKLGGDTAYCVDYGKTLPSGTMTYYKQLSAQAVSVMVYGYPNTSAAEMGCASDDEAYMATQMALWTVTSRTGETEGPRTFNLDNIYAKPGYEDFMQRAAAAAKKLNARAIASPYLPNPSLTLDTNSAKLVNKDGELVTGPYVINVTGGTVSSIKASLDNAPSSAKITDASGNRKTTFTNGEAIYVRLSEKEDGSTMTLNVVADTNKIVGSIYSGDSTSQNFVKIDTVPVELSASVNIKWGTQTGAIEVLKVDQNEDRVAGVKFELRDSSNKKIAEGTTGNDGYIRFSNVKAGEYKLVEISAPEGYIMGDKPLEFKVKAGETFKIKVENKKIVGSLEIIKQDENGTKIPNVTFEILDSNRTKLVEMTTNEEGKAKVNNLKVGTYYYREVSAPVNVIMDKTLREFSITETNKNIVKTVTNAKVKGSLKIIKVDENKEPVANVKFEILNSNKKVIDTITTNESGIAVSKELTPGTYYYREVSAPSHVIIDKTEKEFNVATSGQIIEKTVTNKLAKGRLEIIKQDENKTPVAGVKFNILDANKKVVDVLTTDKDGRATSKNLVLGTYYYKEVEAPTYVIKDETEYEFKLTTNGQVLAKTVVNKLVKGSLNIIKKDEKNTPIPGVTFNILDANKKVVDTIVTDANGRAISKELVTGTYYYKEISAPANVIVDKTEYAFRISDNTPTITKTIVNKLVKGKIEIIKVDEENKPLSGVKFEILDANKKVVDTIVTDTNGRATSKELTLGTYYYKEIEAPSNVVIDTTEYKFSLTSTNRIITKTVVNKLVKGKIEIIKVDEENKPLSGVKFEILDANKNVIDTIITDKDGKATSKELTKGIYYYREIEAPSNIVIDSTEYKFALTNNNQVITKKVVNKLAKGKLEIVKVDEENKPLSGVKFEILDANKNVIDTIITDKDGKATSKDLVIGTYYYREIEAPSNVVIDTTEYKFSLTQNNQVITKKVVNRLVEGKLKIIKVDENDIPLSGVTFNILDSDKNVIDTIVTNTEGIAESKELRKGTYYYQEVSAPDGIIVDNTIYEFSITENGQVVIKNMINYYAKGTLKIIKVDENDIPLAGVTFNILDSDKNVIDTIVTNTEGIAESKELVKGTYYYQEISAPDGIIIDNTMYEFSIEENGQNVIKNMINYYAKGTLKIIKVDENDIPLAGVTFNILDSDKNVIDTIVTNTEGIAESKELVKGTYYYQEVSAPDGIIVDNTMYEFSIEENGQNVIKNMINYYAKGTLKIIKVDENEIPLAGVTFNILDSDKKVIDTIVTNAEGIAESKELTLGTYYYQEVSAPDGIIVDDTMYEFSIEENGQNVIKNMINYYAKGKLKIYKLDKDTEKSIEGVVFNIIDSEGNIVDTITTDNEGIAISKDLVLGTYSFYEVSAPNGYIVDNSTYEFKLTKNNQVRAFKVYNEKEKLPVTGGMISTDMMIIIFVALFSILGYLMMTILEYRKEK